MLKKVLTIIFLFCFTITQAQLRWTIVDSFQNSLPKGLKLFYTNDSIDGKPNIAYYIEADLKNKYLKFDVDTTYKRRLTPNEFYKKNNSPLIIVNGTFFSFKTSQNLNTIIKNGTPLAYNVSSTKGRGKDSVRNVKIYRSAIGISKKGKADIAWIQSDTLEHLTASQLPIEPINTDSVNEITKNKKWVQSHFKNWDVQTAIGGGPVLIQDGEIKITNDEELLFAGKGKFDKHPRTAMGYTANGKLIILVVQGRFPAKAEGADLLQIATILKDIGCVEALNLDGGGSSCMLVNGKETITPSDKTGQRALPAVFIISAKNK
jgi:exopolysaccharide biosynthesis protein